MSYKARIARKRRRDWEDKSGRWARFTGPGWRPLTRHDRLEDIFGGSIGTWGGVRFIESYARGMNASKKVKHRIKTRLW